MKDVNKIMAAIGFTPYSEGIFRYAARTAQLFDAELIVASIINSRDIEAIGMVVSMGYEIDSEHYVEGIKSQRKKMLEQFLSKTSFKRENLKTIFKVGNPVNQLLKITIEEDIDMIVMGVKGRTNLEHAFAGSVATKMFRHSPVPILSYRDEKIAERLRKRIKFN